MMPYEKLGWIKKGFGLTVRLGNVQMRVESNLADVKGNHDKKIMSWSIQFTEEKI